MKLCSLVMVCLLGACAASTGSSETTSIPPSLTSNASCQPANCPDRVAPTQVITEKKGIDIPGAPGFWCSEFHSPGDAASLRACYRVKGTCESARQNAVKKGASTLPCQAREKAHCFLMANTAEQAIFWRCYISEQQCINRHKRLQVKHAGLQFSDCTLTAYAPSGPQVRIATQLAGSDY